MFQLDHAARPVPGEDQTLAVERERLRGAEKFHAATAGGEETLYAGDGAVSERVAAVLRDLEPLAALDPALVPQVERLREAAAAIEDVARDLGRYARGIRSDPARLAEIEERLFLLSRLCRKHGGTVADLAARRDALAAELAAGDGPPRVYVVEPTGPFEDDPNVTDKKFPGNPTRSYRSREPLEIVGEVTDWVRQTPEALQQWRDRLAALIADERGEILN